MAIRIDDWFEAVGLPGTIKTASGWEAVATWPSDRQIPINLEAEMSLPRMARIRDRAFLAGHDQWADSIAEKMADIMVPWPADEPHFVKVEEATGEISCEGMDQREWQPAEFVALAKGFRRPDGGLDVDEGHRWIDSQYAGDDDLPDPPDEPKEKPESSADDPPGITPTPYEWRDAESIPPRQWLYGHHLIRGFLSLTVAPGAVGKSSLMTVETLAMVTGRNLIGDAPPKPLRVWTWNGEDPVDELARRLQAACINYGIGKEDIGDRLMMDSGRHVPIKIATTERNGSKISTPTVKALVKALASAKIDVLIVDPFVTSHSVPENDTTAINEVVSMWRIIADATNCAIELVHHVSKAAALDSAIGIYGSRGAGALIDGVRSARYLAKMSEIEAANFGIEQPDRYFRVQDGKVNLVPASKASWRKMIGVPLHNGAGLWPNGDTMGVCTAWEPPDAFDGVTPSHVQDVQRAISSCDQPPKASERAADWAGYIIGDVLAMDLGRGLKKEQRTAAQNMARAKVRRIMAQWLRSGALVTEATRDSRTGRDVEVIGAGDPMTDADIKGVS
ncbi:AAA family ATPase [Fuscibacter oryzae]|uniref:AAA family ATPase n=1 Tax=Fuscibacter oryzae TaxID=2803939 RepID=A0A8J7MUP2_9RHOB|nr:AAA family ATPase [Fuscibacter oryzae]MBL4928778.1 AAA family ATPase [Fuscibacter oryzae]